MIWKQKCCFHSRSERFNLYKTQHNSQMWKLCYRSYKTSSVSYIMISYLRKKLNHLYYFKLLKHLRENVNFFSFSKWNLFWKVNNFRKVKKYTNKTWHDHERLPGIFWKSSNDIGSSASMQKSCTLKKRKVGCRYILSFGAFWTDWIT